MGTLFKILWTIISFVFMLIIDTIGMLFGAIATTQGHIGTFAVADYGIRKVRKYYGEGN